MTEMLFIKKPYSTKRRGNEEDVNHSTCTLEIKTQVKVTKPEFQLICKKNNTSYKVERLTPIYS